MRAGTCRFCGCTEKRACGIYLPHDFDTVTCTWVDPQRTVCSNIKCIDQYNRERTARRRRASRPRR